MFNAEAVRSTVDTPVAPSSASKTQCPPRPSQSRRLGQPPNFPASSRTEEVGKGGHRACVLGGVTRVGKLSASAILAASVGLFSYHVNRRRRPVGGRGDGGSVK